MKKSVFVFGLIFLLSINFVFAFDSSPGKHEGLWIGQGDKKTEAIYYIPNNFDSSTAEYWFLIHGAGVCGRSGALAHINHWAEVADRENLVLIAPVFDRVYYNSNGGRINDPVFCEEIFRDKYGFTDGVIECQEDVVECEKKFSSSQCEFYEDYSCENHIFGFIDLLNRRDDERSDEKIFEIFDFFNNNLIQRENFNLYGHSAGGQFVSRFMMLYPEYLTRVGVSAAGSMTFPVFDYCYPYSLNMNLIDGPRVEYPEGGEEKPCGGFMGVEQFNNFRDFNKADFNFKMKELLKKDVLIVAGELDDLGTPETHPDRAWQGYYVKDKMRNYYDEMVVKANEFGVSSDKMYYELLIGVGHDWRADGDFTQGFFYPKPLEEIPEKFNDKNSPKVDEDVGRNKLDKSIFYWIIGVIILIGIIVLVIGVILINRFVR